MSNSHNSSSVIDENGMKSKEEETATALRSELAHILNAMWKQPPELLEVEKSPPSTTIWEAQERKRHLQHPTHLANGERD